MYKMLIVEDDNVIAGEIRSQIAPWGVDAEKVNDFRDVMAEFGKFQPHIVLLDISLPFFNGYHWCAQIRNVSKVPIIFVSSASDNMNSNLRRALISRRNSKRSLHIISRTDHLLQADNGRIRRSGAFRYHAKSRNDEKEIRKSINSQLLTVFFMPLVFAAIHLAFAFPMVKKLLALFNLQNTALFAAVTVGTFIIYALFYTLIYKITSNAYCKIVSNAKQA